MSWMLYLFVSCDGFVKNAIRDCLRQFSILLLGFGLLVLILDILIIFSFCLVLPGYFPLSWSLYISNVLKVFSLSFTIYKQL